MRWHSLLTITGILAYSGDRRFTADGSAARPADLPVCEQHITDNRNRWATKYYVLLGNLLNQLILPDMNIINQIVGSRRQRNGEKYPECPVQSLQSEVTTILLLWQLRLRHTDAIRNVSKTGHRLRR